jgi:threonine/homoserine/homoserine lactone efflux protein
MFSIIMFALALVVSASLGAFLTIGALLQASASALVLLKWLGGAYLVWLGVQLWRAPAISYPVRTTEPKPCQPVAKLSWPRPNLGLIANQWLESRCQRGL